MATISPYAFVLGVPDLQKSVAYYRDVLGFRVLWEDGADWRLVERDGVRIMIGHCPDDQEPSKLGSHNWFGYINVDDVAGLRAEITARGAVCSEARDQPYGVREIVVTTADGHRIVFGEERAR